MTQYRDFNPNMKVRVKTSKTKTVAAPMRRAGADSLQDVVSWQRATLVTAAGDELPAWVLKQCGRTILTAVSPAEMIEPVAKEDRKLIGELLAAAS